jgi:hypothetical protein
MSSRCGGLLHLGEPVGVAQLGREAGLRERVQGRAHVLRPHEHLKVLAVAPHAGDAVVGVRAAERVPDPGAAHDLQPAAEELRLRRREVQGPDDRVAAERYLQVAGCLVSGFGNGVHGSPTGWSKQDAGAAGRWSHSAVPASRS